jgi:hypothetical protein
MNKIALFSIAALASLGTVQVAAAAEACNSCRLQGGKTNVAVITLSGAKFTGLAAVQTTVAVNVPAQALKRAPLGNYLDAALYDTFGTHLVSVQRDIRIRHR